MVSAPLGDPLPWLYWLSSWPPVTRNRAKPESVMFSAPPGRTSAADAVPGAAPTPSTPAPTSAVDPSSSPLIFIPSSP